MSEISKLNIKTIKLPSDIDKLITLSFGYSIGISDSEEYIYLFKIQNDDFIQIQKSIYYGWSPIAYIELRNKTLLTAGRNSIYFYKIKNDKLLITDIITNDNNGDSFAELLEVIELENGKIILQNILGDIYVVQKLKNYKECNPEIEYGYIINNNPEYECIHKIPYEKRWIMTPIIYAKENTVFFNNFKIDFSNEKYEKIKINEIKVTKNKFNFNYRFEFKDFILLQLEDLKYAIIDKKYYEIIVKISLKEIKQIIEIDENQYLCTFRGDENKKKIFLIDLTKFLPKIIDSKEYNYNFNREYGDELFIAKYNNQIFVLDNTI